MARKSSNQSPKTPAKNRRNSIAAAIRERGGSLYNIWLIRPSFDDEDVILSSDLAMELLYFIEGEPAFAQIDYSPLRLPTEEGATRISGRPFAKVTTSEERHLTVVFQPATDDSVASAPKNGSEADAKSIVISMADLDAKAQRIENWRRVVPCIRRVRSHPTAMLERRILQRLRHGEQRPLRWLQGQFNSENRGLLFGAIAILLRKRELTSDLDAKPWSLNTLVQS